jgi:putative PIN family toxin of toxin-antitoxin system
MTYQIVIDTNVIISALRSSQGEAYQLVNQIDMGLFEINLSVPLLLEYEDVTKRLLDDLSLSNQEIDDILDYLCAIAHHHQVYYLWRPFLSDPQDDMVLELAVKARCEFIVTYNQKDFKGVEQFGIQVVTPFEFRQKLGG